MQRGRLCLIEDDPIMGESLCERFAFEGYAFDWHQTGASALSAIPQKDYAAVITDIRLPDVSGEELFARLLEQEIRLPPWLFITAYGSIDRAVQALKLGASDYITKPFDIEELIDKTRALIGMPAENAGIPAVLGVSPAMQRIEQLLPRIAKQADSVLISGESGVGKEKVARRLHDLQRGSRPFVAINCSAFAESLLESELFGYERGAFTGAARARRGVFEQAEGGTLFLDEIGDMPGSMQAKVLRAVQERQIMRIGGERPIPVQFWLICATNSDLKQLVEQGRFREDLYYRINLIQVRVPPLRERREDILWLARTFTAEYGQVTPGVRKRLGPAAESGLIRYHWPGNIRELQHCVHRACILSGRPVIEPWDLFEESSPAWQVDPDGNAESLAHYLRACERDFILRALDAHRWQMSETASHLGISRKNLWEKMRKLEIRSPSNP